MRTYAKACVRRVFARTCTQVDLPSKSPKYASICFLPIDAESLVDTGVINLDKGSCVHYGDLSSDDRRLRRILSFIAAAKPNEFEDSKVRVRIAFSDGKVLYVNQMGQLKFNEKTLKFESDDFLSFKKIIEKMDEEVRSR